MNVTVIVPAAGASSRFGSDKLAADLGGRPLLVRTIETFSKRQEVSQIIVAGPPDRFEAFSDRFGPVLGFHGVLLIEGGRTDRWETIALAIPHVAPDATHIAVHDAARPCVGHAMLDRLFEAAQQLDAVIPGVGLSSTIKEVDASAAANVAQADALVDAILGASSAPVIEARPVARTIPRDRLVEAQTPQVFAAQVLRDAYESGDVEGTTDDASVLERAGQTVQVVEGDPRNIKVTRPADLELARALLRSGALD